MGRILLGAVLQESNSFSPRISTWDDFKIFQGKEMFQKIAAGQVFGNAGHDPIPTLYAYAVPGGRIEEQSFRRFMACILDGAAAGEIDGIWLYLHGAMEVVGIGSGETAIVSALRKKFGPRTPIALALDFHGNNTAELIRQTDILVGYKTAPHVDGEATQIRAAEMLVRCLKEKIRPRTFMVRLPLIIQGERETTGVEPMRTIMARIAEAEQIPGIWSASYFGGMAWVDAPHSSVTLTVTAEPQPPAAGAAGDPFGHAKSMLLGLARLVWDSRTKFRFEEETMEAEDALRAADQADQADQQESGSAEPGTARTLFITDSGDNVTAGAPGDSAFFLDLAVRMGSRAALIAGIVDAQGVRAWDGEAAGAAKRIRIGGTMDPSSTCAQLWCTLKWRGMVLDNSGERRTGGILIACAAEPHGPTVDAILTDDRCSFTRPEIIESPGIRIGDYATVVVKQGYLFPLLRDLARRSILAFSPGTACQDLSRFTYTRLTRPLYPMDGDFSWAPSEKDII